jgi:hypothetical protein
VKRTLPRSLSVITGRRAQTAVLGVAAAAIIGGLGIGIANGSNSPAAAAPAATGVSALAAAPAAPAPPAQPAPPPAKPAKPATARKVPAAKSLRHQAKLQTTYYYCGPAATRIALSAHLKKVPSQSTLAKQLGTTTDGTNSAYDITRVLNKQLHAKRYHTTVIPGKKATAKQIERLRRDVVASINNGDPVVANIAGTVWDTAGEKHSYEGGHYLAVVGYSNHGKTVKIADSADTVGRNTYKLPVKKLANWIASRGYSS